jgi:hypothetical protein
LQQRRSAQPPGSIWDAGASLWDGNQSSWDSYPLDLTVSLSPAAHTLHAESSLAARIFATPRLSLVPGAWEPVIARGDLPAQVRSSQLFTISLSPAVHALHAQAPLAARVFPRPVSAGVVIRPHPLHAVGQLPARITAATSLMSATIDHLRQHVPALGGRVAGAADFVAGLREYNATMPLPAGYVLPLDQDSPGNEVMIGLIQTVTRTIGVAVEFDATGDRRGQTPAMRFDEIQDQLCQALLLWQPASSRGGPGTGRVPNQQGFWFAGGRMLDLDRARLFYQWEFSLQWQLFSVG